METIDENSIFDILDSHKNICRFCFYQFNEDNTTESYSISDDYIQKQLNYCFPDLKFYKEKNIPNLICTECINLLNSTYNLSIKIHGSQDIFEKYACRQKLRTELFNSNTENSSLMVSKEHNNVSDQFCHNDSREDCLSDFEQEKYLLNQKISVAKKKKSKQSKFKCCHEEFKTKSQYLAHIKSHGVSFKKFTCLACDKKYSSQFELDIHFRKHSGEKPFSCSLCEKMFTDKRNLKKHEKIHIGKKNHECLVCHKKFLHLFSLKTHERIHTGEKLFVCETCGAAFNTSTQLTIHNRIHTNEKPYNCSYCDKKFSSKSALNNHHLVHTGENKFTCTLCDKQFRRLFDMKTHLRSHTNEKPYVCKYPNCEKQYKTSSQLRVHYRTHTGEKRHQCAICFKQFGETTTLKRHIGTHEKVYEKT
ncbi:zinc finger protein 664-like [Sitophilus oryzae]|uniref:Zinc finger protein 664-like n=1 Tax=Sitophilus oryzae TaxID=7048 RepID=A0A6J2Y128_SITOR|nr:zinc finger protein 664-like [Sitophilus oryzae]